MSAAGVVPSPTPYMRDTGQTAKVGTLDGTNLGQVPSDPASGAQISEADSPTNWDYSRDKLGTIGQKPCPRPLIPVGQAYKASWTLADWRAFHAERLAIRLYDGGMSEGDAARWAWLDCVAKWLERHPPLSEAKANWGGTEEEFRLCRIDDSIAALSLLAVSPPQTAKGRVLPP
jgi:hypothetical protein